MVPLVAACFLTGLLWKIARASRGPRLVAWGWGIGWPIGFFLWVALWFSFGGGTGVPEVEVIAIALVGWFVWTSGMFLTASPRFWPLGVALCVFDLLMLAAIRTSLPSGTGLVLLDVEGAVIALLPLLKARIDAPRSGVAQACPA